MVSETLREITPSLGDGQYRIVSTLQEGRLYLAEKSGKRLVLKTAQGARGLELLKREYELALRLQHPFIASAIGWEESTPIGPAIVIEYIRGRNLSAFLKEKPSMQTRRRIFSQLLEAVGAMHRQSIIHNDIKPENILITEADNDVKLIDFGFADGDAHILEKGLGGTRQYASPELLEHRKTDARSDIYSLGILLDEVFPGRYGRVVRRCTQADPARRYQSAEALQKALDGYYRPIRITLFAVLAAAAVGLLALQQLALRDVKSAAAAQHLVDGRTVDSLENAVGRMASTVDSLSSALDAINSEQSEREIILARAKAAVDQGYARIIPKYETALAGARTQEEATAAWAALSEDYNRMNNKVLTSVPDPLRPSVREYLFERYNGAFPGLYDAFVARVNELSR